MDDEIEDIIGDVKYTDSQKSVATTNLSVATTNLSVTTTNLSVTTTNLVSTAYSPDFTDSSPERNNSSGKETYVIEWDSEDSDLMFPLRDSKSVINLSDRANNLSDRANNLSDRANTQITSQLNMNMTNNSQTSDNTKSACTCHQSIAQETFTQTSKTIFELAEVEGVIAKPVQNNTLETQTSFISITEKKFEYKIEVKKEEIESNYISTNMCGDAACYNEEKFNIICNTFTGSLDDGSSKFPISETENEDDHSCVSSSDEIIRIINDDSKENMLAERTEDDKESPPPSDMEDDSLMASSNTIISSNKDVRELRTRLNESVDLCKDRYADPESRLLGTLTPLTEESHRRDSLMDITPFDNVTTNSHDEILFTNNAGMKIKLLKDDEFKLPPIQNQSCPNSPLTNLFNNKLNKLYKAGTLPCLYERKKDMASDRWEMDNKNLAAGESLLISSKNSNGNGSPRKIILPPIQMEGSNVSRTECQSNNNIGSNRSPPVPARKAICIKEKIKELKMPPEKKSWTNATKYNSVSRPDSRSVSPSNVSTLDDQHRLCEVAEKGCDVLCLEMLRRLRSNTWYEVIETLDETQRVMEKFWGVITETRVADLLRMINGLIDSPRPQVARSACAAVALIIKNTNYSKKPDFYESMSALLAKTGSYSRPLRRAANVALDDIVCSLEHAPCVSALAPRVGHKNALVRCAAARLLVVCCALAGGGRNLLKARPPTAANARRCALRALAALLDDKSTDTRKYAERLYSMLRPLQNFDAYYLTDVDIETATRQMKKYDALLVCEPMKEER